MEQAVKECIEKFASALIDQNSAKVIIDPNSNSKGFGFGGGKIILLNQKNNVTRQ